MDGRYSVRREAWPCEFCLRTHPAYVTQGGNSIRTRVYCPQLGMYVYSPRGLRY